MTFFSYWHQNRNSELKTYFFLKKTHSVAASKIVHCVKRATNITARENKNTKK